jgi:hypothetical protein
VKVQVSGQVLSQSQAARLVIGQARVTSEVFERTFVSNSRFRGWTRVREFEEATGKTMIHIHNTCGQAAYKKRKAFPADLSNAAFLRPHGPLHTRCWLQAFASNAKRPYQRQPKHASGQAT